MKDELIPDHAVAMSVQLGNYYPTVELSLNQALLYLKGETSLQIALNKGWHIVTFQGQSIGFVKSLGNRLNNYFPKEWRIRMQIQGRISE
jgi:NOL1/NOP2/fmu family ribosome biogenesis protein